MFPRPRPARATRRGLVGSRYLSCMSAPTAAKRLPIGGTELAVSGLVAAGCLAVNALAVASLPALSVDELGPLALAYHDKQPHPAFASVAVFVLLLGSWLPRAGRAAVLVFVGAAVANFLSPSIWGPGAPDYIVFLELDVIANISDLLMLSAAVVVVASVGLAMLRCARNRLAAARSG